MAKKIPMSFMDSPLSTFVINLDLAWSKNLCDDEYFPTAFAQRPLLDQLID